MHDTFGKRLRRLREQKPMGLRELARTAVVPVSTLSCLESGSRDGNGISVETAKRLARTLGVDLNYLCRFYDECEAQQHAGAED